MLLSGDTRRPNATTKGTKSTKGGHEDAATACHRAARRAAVGGDERPFVLLVLFVAPNGRRKLLGEKNALQLRGHDGVGEVAHELGGAHAVHHAVVARKRHRQHRPHGRLTVHRDDPVGDLAADCVRDEASYKVRSISQLRDRMIELGACREAFEALDTALEEWRAP